MTETVRSRNGAVRKIVLEYAAKHPGELLHVNTISADTGLRPDQVSAAIRRMIDEGTTGNWEVNLRGAAWTYYPKSGKREGDWILLERLLRLDSEAEGVKVLVRDEDGQLWTMTPTKL